MYNIRQIQVFGEIMKDILAKISELREKHNWTEYQLAERAGLPQSTISSWYNKGKKPSLSTLDKVCAALDVSLSQLFAENVDLVALTPEQRELLDNWACLNTEQQQFVLQMNQHML